MVQNIFKSHFGLGNSLEKVKFGPHNWFFSFFWKSFFQFSSITHFLSHTFQDPSCRICSYGPQGPFWFSVKKWPGAVKRYQKNENGEKSHFEITVKMNLFCGGMFWKAPLCLWSSRKGFHFWKTNISGIWGHAHVGKVCISSYYFVILQMTPTVAATTRRQFFPSGQTPSP